MEQIYHKSVETKTTGLYNAIVSSGNIDSLRKIKASRCVHRPLAPTTITISSCPHDLLQYHDRCFSSHFFLTIPSTAMSRVG
eukprot:scaffold4837_cov163-Ochromonas_danica.AAC.3